MKPKIFRSKAKTPMMHYYSGKNGFQIPESSMAAKGDVGKQAVMVQEVDPNQLIPKDGVLGFERGSGFEQVTNFTVEVGGYVGDGEGQVIGYILHLLMAMTDPLYEQSNHSR